MIWVDSKKMMPCNGRRVIGITPSGHFFPVFRENKSNCWTDAGGNTYSSETIEFWLDIIHPKDRERLNNAYLDLNISRVSVDKLNLTASDLPIIKDRIRYNKLFERVAT